jgi:hypothetical protein
MVGDGRPFRLPAVARYAEQGRCAICWRVQALIADPATISPAHA